MSEQEIIYEPHPVTPERKADLRAAGFKIIDAIFAPQDKSAAPIELGTDSGDQFSDDELRKIITEITGKAPHPKTGRAKLIAMFNELNAA